MLYDFKCPHGHMFEHVCRMDDRLKKIPCEGTVGQVVGDDLYDKHLSGEVPLPEGLFWVKLGEEEAEAVDGEEASNEDKVLMRNVPCQLRAEIFVGTHNNPRNILDHGLASNRDAAREGRYDPLKPNTRFMAKGRGWRK